MKNISIVLLFSLFITSCSLFERRTDDERIARAYGKDLYRSELKDLVRPGTSLSDSAIIVQRYIDNWIRQQVYLNEALSSLPSEKIDFERRIEDYKNSLIIFTHETELIRSKLDTVIDAEVIQTYFETNQEDFRLREHIVKLNYVKVPLNAPDVNIVRRLIRSEKPDDLENLEEYAINNAASYYLDQESWFIFTDILRDVPINPNNHESFLRNNRFLELNDSYYRYFLFIRDYKLEGSVSPLAFQEENIKAIILNHRKQNFINEHRQNSFKEAVRNRDFEVFN